MITELKDVREPHIRSLVHDHIRQREHGHVHVHGHRHRIVDELGLNGTNRIDVVSISETMDGYEIKSPADSLVRLPEQIRSYSRVMDTTTLVASADHIAAAVPMIPITWGVIEVSVNENGPVLIPRWEPHRNLDVNPRALAELLWREEALEVLTILGNDRGVRSKPRARIWDRMVDTMTTDQVRAVVRNVLIYRRGWKGNRVHVPISSWLNPDGSITPP